MDVIHVCLEEESYEVNAVIDFMTSIYPYRKQERCKTFLFNINLKYFHSDASFNSFLVDDALHLLKQR